MKQNKKHKLSAQKIILTVVAVVTVFNTALLACMFLWFQSVSKDLEFSRLMYLVDRDMQANQNACFKKQDLECKDSKYVDVSEHRKMLVDFMYKENGIKN